MSRDTSTKNLKYSPKKVWLGYETFSTRRLLHSSRFESTAASPADTQIPPDYQRRDDYGG